jgi:transitional endoplasmic reticulum ATPase
VNSNIGPQRLVARVRYVDWQERRVYLELRNGMALVRELNDEEQEGHQDAFAVGDVVMVGPQWDNIDFGVGQLWPDDRYLATVRKVMDEELIIESGLRFHAVARPPGLDVSEGWTAEVSDLVGVLRIVTKDTIGLSALAERHEINIDGFKSTPTESLTMDDFAGNARIKERARELIELPLKNAEKFAKINARLIRGVLFSRPSGTGKTILAKIVASMAQATCYIVSGPQIFSKWYGQSEELLRTLFADAARQERAVIVFDEIDSVASQRDEDSHEMSKRIVGQLLTEMDGFSARDNVIEAYSAKTHDLVDQGLTCEYSIGSPDDHAH